MSELPLFRALVYTGIGGLTGTETGEANDSQVVVIHRTDFS